MDGDAGEEVEEEEKEDTALVQSLSSREEMELCTVGLVMMTLSLRVTFNAVGLKFT